MDIFKSLHWLYYNIAFIFSFLPCGILVLWPGTELISSTLEGDVLTTGPAGKSLLNFAVNLKLSFKKWNLLLLLSENKYSEGSKMLIVLSLDEEIMSNCLCVLTFQISHILILSGFMCHFINQVKQRYSLKILPEWLFSEAETVFAQNSLLCSSLFPVGT